MAAQAVKPPMPDLLGRKDAPGGAWHIEPVPMEPGRAKTSIFAREMHVPLGDNEQERVVRAHEMMHAKCSPVDTFGEWVARGFASSLALEVAEELRVNVLCDRAGFDVKHHLTDGSEKQTGERIAQQDEWATGVYMTAAFAGTARLRPFISGVRKHNPEWADAYRALATRLLALARQVKTHELGATDVDPASTLAPRGFRFAEAWAVLLDRIANPPKAEEEPDTKPGGSDSGGSGPSEDEDGVVNPGGSGKDDRKRHRKPPVSADEIKKIKTPDKKKGYASGGWDDLRVERCPMPRHLPGGLGKARRPADRGRHPRRIHRILTDPQKRVFDATKRGNGGVVLIDGSGSMSLTSKDVLDIVEAAPGATVAVYTSNCDGVTPNLFVLADKGRMVEEIPSGNIGNGVDGPAAEWAVAAKQRSSSPVVWVTDGGVHGKLGGYFDTLGIDCLEKVRKHNIVVTPNVAGAVEVLRTLASGGKPKRWLPYSWRKSWQDVMGAPLR